MKSFKEYLTESKKTYDFRIKIAGDLPEGADSMMKTALEKYGVENYKKLSKTMVQEHPLDFPQLKNIAVNVFETSLNYPTTQETLRDYLCDYLDINHTNLKVKKPGEPTEERTSETFLSCLNLYNPVVGVSNIKPDIIP